MATFTKKTLEPTGGTTAASHTAGAVCYPVFTAVDADQANAVASTLTTKGDVLATDGSVLNRLAVGANGSIFIADSTASNGVSWLASGTAGYALVSAGPGNALTWAVAASPSDSDQNILAVQIFN